MSVYYFKPNPGGQHQASVSTADVLFVDGANQSGKSTILTWLVAASMLPSPTNSKYSHYPCDPDFDAATPWTNNATRQLRRTRKFRLPTHNWMVSPDMEMHRWVAMQELPEMLDPYINHKLTKWSKSVKGVWDTITLLEEFGGSVLSLKSWQQWKNNKHVMTGARLDNVFIDEPFPKGVFGEYLMRTASKQGRIVISATLVDNDDDDPMSREAEWMEEQFIVPAEQGVLKPNVDVINIPLEENPHININAFNSRLALLDESERSIRSRGRRMRRHGRPYFNRSQIDEMIERVTHPVSEGYLMDSEILGDIYATDGLTYDAGDPIARSVVPPDTTNIVYRIWEYPDTNEPGYIIAVDPADGGTSANDIMVFATDPLRMVCNANGIFPEDELPSELIKICHWYGGDDLVDGTTWDGNLDVPAVEVPRLEKVLVGIETNRVKTTLSAMQRGYIELGVYPPLPKLYCMPTRSTLGRDLHFPGKTLGWHTDATTRPYLLAGAKTLITKAVKTSDYNIIPCEHTLQELWDIVDQGGKYKAPKRKRDDRVMTLGLIQMMAKQRHFRPRTVEVKAPERHPFNINISMDTAVPPAYQRSRQRSIRYG